jgi:hypothetical protein
VMRFDYDVSAGLPGAPANLRIVSP